MYVNVVCVGGRKFICIIQACAPRHTLIQPFSHCAIQAFTIRRHRRHRRRPFSGRWSANSPAGCHKCKQQCDDLIVI